MKTISIPPPINTEEYAHLTADPPEIAGIRSFLDCARRGRHPGASTGEKACLKLLKQGEALSATLQEIDGGKQAAFCDLLRAMAWPDTRETLVAIAQRIGR